MIEPGEEALLQDEIWDLMLGFAAAGRIREQITNYLKQLRLPDGAIEIVRREIDEIDAAFLEESEQSALTDPWCSYFRDLDMSDLSLFHPNKRFSTKKAYAAIRLWYQSNKGELARLGQRTDDYVERSISLIETLPPVTSVNGLEIRAVFQEALMGLLEWAFNDSDGKYKMSEYAKLALQAEGLAFWLSEDESKELMSSWIWPYIKP